MTDVSIQFHMTPEELLPIFRSFIDDVNGKVAAITFQPFQARELTPSELGDAFVDSTFDRLAVTLSKPTLPVSGMVQFSEENPDALFLDVGRESADGLHQSWLAARTENAEALQAWQDFARRVRRATRAGATAEDPRTGARSRMKNYRYSPGAKRLQENGVAMRPAAGTARLTLEE